jgi:hypothetical protein
VAETVEDEEARFVWGRLEKTRIVVGVLTRQMSGWPFFKEVSSWISTAIC